MPTPTFIQQNSGSTNGSTNPVTVAFTSNTTAASLLVCFIQSGGGVQPTSVTDTQGNGPSGSYKLAGKLNGTAGVSDVAVYYAWNTTGGADTVSVHWASPDNFGLIIIGEWSNLRTASDPLETSGFAAAQSTTGANPISSGNVTTTQTGDLIIASFFDNNQGLNNSSFGMTLLKTYSFSQNALKQEIVGAAGTYAAQSTTSGGSLEYAIAVAFLTPAVTPPPVVTPGFLGSFSGQFFTGRRF